MGLQPYYRAEDQTSAYQLRYTWCGWPSDAQLPALPDDAWVELSKAWETDGLRALEKELTAERIQITFSTTPQISPVLITTRAKGRLDHSFRSVAGRSVPFSRKVSLRSVGENTADCVTKYIESQILNERFVDPAFAQMLSKFTWTDLNFNFTEPTETRSGRYWYNLHLVLVTDGRYRFSEEDILRKVFEVSFKIATKKEYRIKSISVMPDHLHVALRGAIEASPESIALAFQNNLAFIVDRGAIWRPGYYVGTFGEYNMNAIRTRNREESASPVTRGHGGRG
jgi:REP element-mobilizing transposase RayT